MTTPKTFEEFAKQNDLGGNWTKKDLKMLWKTAEAVGTHEGRAAGEVWDCSDCFEEGHKEGYAKGIEDAAQLVTEWTESPHWSGSIPTEISDEIRALAKPQQEGE